MDRSVLKSIINEEKRLYFASASDFKKMKRCRHKRYYIFMYLYCFRWCRYYRDLRQNKNSSYIQKRFSKLMFRYYEKKKNIYSYKSGVEIGLSSNIGRCLDIWHSGVVINGNIGDNCIFHGKNTVGNKGYGMETMCPEIGNNVDFGAGSVAIGDIRIASNCVIGAGAVVTKSFNEPGSVIVGVPGKIKKQG